MVTQPLHCVGGGTYAWQNHFAGASYHVGRSSQACAVAQAVERELQRSYVRAAAVNDGNGFGHISSRSPSS
jgi:hypothetical protein